MNALLNGLKNAANFGYTENGAIKRNTTMSGLLDLFAMGAAMRQRSDADCILLFKKAYEENSEYAMKCLFYIRDIKAQGERRFFRVIMKWLAINHTEVARRNLQYVAEFGRWDDLYCFVDTPLEEEAFKFMKTQLTLDINSETPSLLAKWLKSCNCSSKEAIRLGELTRKYFNMTHKQYRKTLAYLRTKINIVEKLMSENRWSEIQFDKISSKAGFIYRNAFARHDIIKEKYEKFAKDATTTVNAGALYPYEVVEKAVNLMCNHRSVVPKNVALDDTERLMINKYWDNLTDYFAGSKLNALCMVDTSGSMIGTPMNVAVSLGLYCAEKAGGPFANHYISFSACPQLIECEGVDFCDKVSRIVRTNLCQNTNIEAAFDMVFNTALINHVAQKDLPETILVISDMEFDQASRGFAQARAETVMEGIARKWELYGYQMPKLVFWNVNARSNNIPMLGKENISFVSGFSPSIFQIIATGKAGIDLMMETLNKARYSCIKGE